MKRPGKLKVSFLFSLALNLAFAALLSILWLKSSAIRLNVYEALGARLGRAEIAFIGDSITREGGLWGQRLGKPVGTVTNLGHSALYVEQMQYQAELAVAAKVKFVFIMGGINDALRDDYSPRTCFAEYKEILDYLESHGVTSVIQSTLFRGNDESREFVTELNGFLADYAAEKNAHFLDLNQVLAPGNTLKNEYSRDGTHLTEVAYQTWAEQLTSFLAKEVRK